MKSFRCSSILVLVSLGPFWLVAAPVNDGTTTDGLIQITTTVSPGVATGLEVTGEGDLSATNSQPIFTFPFAHTAWYAEALVATGTAYTVTGDFRPELAAEPFQGGVVGWLDEQSVRGFVFSLVPGGTTPGVEVHSLDLAGGVRGFEGLYDTNGVAVSGIAADWRSDFTVDYQVANFATLELTFSEPSAEDLAVLTNATAHLTARALQDNGSGSGPVSGTIELLTDVPAPSAMEHRFGYYAVYANTLAYQGPIGRLDNLTVAGDIGAGNRRPDVQLVRPSEGATFFAPVTITIEAQASDPDANGSIQSVDFYEGSNLLGSRNAEPYTLDWAVATVGTYTLTAVATDDQGATRTSDPVHITVEQSSGVPPTLTVSEMDGIVTIMWDQPGYTLESTTDLGTIWVPVNTTGAQQHVEPASGPRKFYRLVGGGQGGGPELTIGISGDTITIGGIQAGYALESTTDLGTTWTPIATTGNQYSETVSGARKFFRLRQ